MPDGRTVNVADIDIKPTSECVLPPADRVTPVLTYCAATDACPALCLRRSEFAPDDPDTERLLQQQAHQASAESDRRSFQDRSRAGRRLPPPPLEQTDRDAHSESVLHHDDHAASPAPRPWTDHDRLPHATSHDGWGGHHLDHPAASDRGQYAEDHGHGGNGPYVTWEEVGAAAESWRGLHWTNIDNALDIEL